MKKYLLYIVIFLIGALAGMWAHRQYHFRDDTKMLQNDTIVRFDTIRHSRLELTTNTCKLNIPKISRKELVYIPSDSVSIIYRDSIRYVTLPRQYFYTKVEDAEIWHSGIDSTIDSLNVVRKTTNVTETIQRKPKKNSCSIGIEATYTGAFRMPIQAQYSHKIIPWLSIYGYAEYDVITRQMGVGVGTQITLEY